ncbi:MAG: hypothetical protein Q8K75_12350 [Chlamydiales bacterium]|nr:hypothetical protein [Chlamydiales bacterium]
MKKLLLLLALAVSGTSSLQAMPAQVIIIRHGEKPLKGNDLDTKGKERAAALAPFFLGTPLLQKFGLPVAVYAQRPSSEDPSMRPIQTATPIAEALGIKVNTTYQHLQFARMAQEIRTRPEFHGKVVLVAWEHHVIPELARKLGAKNAPKKWDGDVFDRLWVITYDGSQVLFQDLPQRLLYGDSPR